MLSIPLLRTYSNNEDDGGDDVGGNYQEGELNENTVADAALSKVWGLSMRPVENNYWSPGVNISWKLTAIPWILSQSPRQAAQKHWVKLFTAMFTLSPGGTECTR